MSGDALRARSAELRKLIVRVICRTPGGHLGAALSIADLLTVLYTDILAVDPARPDDPSRDRFVLSKGHAAVALYAALYQAGFISREILDSFGSRGTVLGGHPDMHKVPGVEASTGALGHGLSFGVGTALSGRLENRGFRVFVLLGDGECQEGSVWEALLFAPAHALDNLTVIVDYNKLQAMDRLESIVPLEPLADKLRAFGWEVREIDGHDVDEIRETLSRVPLAPGRPSAIVAHTVKGKGISFMENVPIWHYRLPDEEERRIICRELEMEGL